MLQSLLRWHVELHTTKAFEHMKSCPPMRECCMQILEHGFCMSCILILFAPKTVSAAQAFTYVYCQQEVQLVLIGA